MLLNAGALPVPVKLVEQRTVGATLGSESITKSIVAGLIGILAVMIFMIAYYRLAGCVTSVDSKRVFYDSSRMEDNGYFNDGKLTWLTGLNAGVSMDVNGWDLDSHCFTLWLSVPYEIQVGDTYSVTPGCDKRFATCRARFNNIVNYGGFPHLPGLGKLLLYPDNS